MLPDADSFKGPRAFNSADRLEEGLSQKTNAAASEGAADVSSAKAAAAGYVEQAKNLAGGAIATAQVRRLLLHPSPEPLAHVRYSRTFPVLLAIRRQRRRQMAPMSSSRPSRRAKSTSPRRRQPLSHMSTLL